VRQAKPNRAIAIIPHNINGVPANEGWKWGTRIARGLCYESAGMDRARRAGAKGFAAGLLFGGVIMFAWMLGLGWQPASSCVDVGPYVAVPNG
jgi:hypothetical protein